MTAQTDVQRLAALVEDLTRELFEASRTHSKAHRDILMLTEQTLDAVKQVLQTVKFDSEALDERVNVSLRPSTIAKIVPWLIAAASAVATAVQHYWR